MANLLQITYTAMGWKTLSGYAGGSLGSHRGPRRFLSLAGLTRSVFRYDEGCAIFTETLGNRHDRLIDRRHTVSVTRSSRLIYQSPTRSASRCYPCERWTTFPSTGGPCDRTEYARALVAMGFLASADTPPQGRVFFLHIASSRSPTTLSVFCCRTTRCAMSGLRA